MSQVPRPRLAPGRSSPAGHLQGLRISRHHTQRSLAHEIGTTPQAISQYELGKASPSPTVERRLARALRASVLELRRALAADRGQEHVATSKERGKGRRRGVARALQLMAMEVSPAPAPEAEGEGDAALGGGEG